jgi:hypothetical protein
MICNISFADKIIQSVPWAQQFVLRADLMLIKQDKKRDGADTLLTRER